jgi:hypothetical protein
MGLLSFARDREFRRDASFSPAAPVDSKVNDTSEGLERSAGVEDKF